MADLKKYKIFVNKHFISLNLYTFAYELLAFLSKCHSWIGFFTIVAKPSRAHRTYHIIYHVGHIPLTPRIIPKEI